MYPRTSISEHMRLSKNRFHFIKQIQELSMVLGQ